jgi:hypothetical protein
MSNFDLKTISAVSGKSPIFQLTIDDKPDYSNASTEEARNDRKTGVLDIYEQRLEKKYKNNIIQIYNTMTRVANHELVPVEKFRELKGRKKSDPYKDYEFKHGDLRLYATQSPLGKIIILGGFKNAQEGDIRKMRSLKAQYFESLKIKK